MHTLNYNGKLITLDRPLVMGILNVTNDSFYSNSRVENVGIALKQVEKFINEGVDMIDIGGMSSRPGAVEISAEEELRKIAPIVEKISTHFPQVIISVDTYRSSVAEAVCQLGVGIINDISAGTFDEKMFATIAKNKVIYVMMHSTNDAAASRL
jgi:dihydropteroate synthase